MQRSLAGRSRTVDVACQIRPMPAVTAQPPSSARRQQLLQGASLLAGSALLPLLNSRPAYAVPTKTSPFAKPGEVVKVDVTPAQLKELGVERWAIWNHPIDKYQYTYDVDEDVYLLRGAITITPAGGQPVSFKAGDFVSFGKGLTCTWSVDSPVYKHYKEY